LHVTLHEPALQTGVAFATLVEQPLPQEPQLFASFDVLTHEPPQSVGVDAGQPDTHVELEHAGVPLSAAQVWPQAEQLFGSVVVSTQAPPQSVYPLLQLVPQLPPLHVAEPLATDGHPYPQLPQLFGSPAVFVHVPPQSGSFEAHPETHAYVPPDPAAHTGVPLSAEQEVPHAPQFAVVVYWTHAPWHCE
jgi:hypothetical protein